LFCSGAKTSADGILFYVVQVVEVILFAFDAVFFKASFPYIEWAFELEREASLDILHGFFERYVFGGCQKQMDVVGHDDVCVELEAALLTVFLEYVE
jgi:hypothetical protein